MKIELEPNLPQHWYWVDNEILVPSVTTIIEKYPKSYELIRWIAEKGLTEADRIKTEAGSAGSKIHKAIDLLIQGEEILIEDFTRTEWLKLIGFVNWNAKFKPEYIQNERGIYSKEYKYAGTTDCIAKINDCVYLIDWKSSRNMQPYFALQVAAYAQALSEEKIKVEKTAVLQLGVNKDGYRFKEYDDWKADFKVFLGVKQIFDYEEGTDPPKIPEVPLILKL